MQEAKAAASVADRSLKPDYEVASEKTGDNPKSRNLAAYAYGVEPDLGAIVGWGSERIKRRQAEVDFAGLD